MLNKNISSSYGQKDLIIFPQTIGRITFYTRKELMDWVCLQQNMLNEKYDMGLEVIKIGDGNESEG